MARWIQQLIVLCLLLALLGLVQWWRRSAALEAGRVEGRPHVIDGDSLRIGGSEIRLDGIDAPESRQTCQRDEETWPCGRRVRDELDRLIAGRSVVCRGRERDQHGRMLGMCEVEGLAVNSAMVRAGWAVAYDGRLANEEREARAARRGLWAGEFERPRDWRRRNGVGR